MPNEYDQGLIDLFQGRADAQTAIYDSDDEFVARVSAMIDALPSHLAGNVGIISAWRSYEEQEYLYDLYKSGRGNLAAPPGKSNHNRGLAMDLAFHSDAARQWIHSNAHRFGLHFPVNGEDWHVEPMGLKDGTFHNGTQRFEGISGDAYSDMYGQPASEVNNHSAETQLLRVADMLMGGTFRSKQRVMRDPRGLAEENQNEGVHYHG